MDVAKGFRRKREERELDQQELARMAGVSKAMICAIEKGQRIPSLFTVAAVADVLHCSTDELLDREVS